MIFRDIPGPGICKKKIQNFPGGVGTLYTPPLALILFSSVPTMRTCLYNSL